MSPHTAPILLLIASNVFMTFAWYGHLKFKTSPLWIAVMASWGIAFVEYWFAVPANRIGSAVYSAAELKTMQEVITLVVFAGFSVLYLKEPLGLNHLIGIPNTIVVQLILIAGVTAAATISVVTGVDKGIRILSETNLVLAILLLGLDVSPARRSRADLDRLVSFQRRRHTVRDGVNGPCRFN